MSSGGCLKTRVKWVLTYAGLMAMLVFGVGCQKEPAPDDSSPENASATNSVMDANASLNNDSPAPSEPPAPPKPTNRLELYRKAFDSMRLIHFKDLVEFHPDRITKFRTISEESEEYTELLDVLDYISQAAFSDLPLDWRIDFTLFPDIEVDHWKYIQHGFNVVQWWVHKFIVEGEIETAYQIFQIGLKLADDVVSDRTLPGALLAMQVRDEMIQTLIDNFSLLSEEDSRHLLVNLIPHAKKREPWISQNYQSAKVEMEWFIRKTQELHGRYRTTGIVPDLDDLPRDFVVGFYVLDGYMNPVDKAILKGIPASELRSNRQKAMEIITGIQVDHGRENLVKMLSYSPEQLEGMFSTIRALHAKVGDALSEESWKGYFDAVSEVTAEIYDVPFLWNHSLAWIKARKMEFYSRLKYHLVLGGLVYHSTQLQYLPQVANPITGSIPKMSRFDESGEDIGFFVFVNDLDVPTHQAFKPFHQVLFISSRDHNYYGYGIQIGHPVRDE